MKCPECGCSWISVLESRHTSEKAISRRRQCKGCDHIWATAEVPVRMESGATSLLSDLTARPSLSLECIAGCLNVWHLRELV